jgi:peptidoglycan hydrolase CwlO-like protein
LTYVKKGEKLDTHAGSHKAATDKAAKQTEGALQVLHASHQDASAKIVDLQRRIDDVDKEVKAYMQKGQRERAKVALRRKKVLEKQAQAVQNVCYLFLWLAER